MKKVFLLCLLLSSFCVKPTLYAQQQPAQSADSAPLVQGIRLAGSTAGIYRVPLQQLPASWQAAPEYIRIFHDSHELPRLFSASEMLFYLPPSSHLWSDHIGAVLRYTPEQAGLALQTELLAPAMDSTITYYTATARLEQQAFYISSHPVGEQQDHWWGWFWLRIGTSMPAPITIDVNINDAEAVLDQPAGLKLRLHGGARGTNHQLAVQVNGTQLGTLSWSGPTLYEPELAIPASVLTQTNVVKLQPLVPANAQSGSLENGYVDWVAIEYQRVLDPAAQPITFHGTPGSFQVPVSAHETMTLWDVSDPLQPLILQPQTAAPSTLAWSSAISRTYVVAPAASFMVPTMALWQQPDLRNQSQQIDYLAITYNPPQQSTWSSALQPLIDHRAAQGLSPMVVDVQWIYDQFGSGLIEPQAIRRFLAYTFEAWPAPAPQYVLLVGDGTNDPRRFLGNLAQNQTFIPPYLSYVDPWLGETAADNRYVTLAGQDDLPEMHIGRLPVQSAAQITNLVQKTIAFESTSSDAAWLNRAIFVADDPEPLSAGDFHALSEAARSQLPATFISPTLYYTSQADLAQFRSAVVEEINQGALFVSYIGHAGIDVWANESLYRATEVAQLANQDRLPIMLPMTCFTGYYHDPVTASLTEHELLHPVGGSVAAWSPTGLGVATGHDYLQRGLFTAVFDHGMRRLGPATLYGKQFLAEQGVALDLLNTYTVFGDPALLIPLPYQSIQAMPDMYTLHHPNTALQLDVLSNDINPYATALIIDHYSTPSVGELTLDASRQSLRYQLSHSYVGEVHFSYTVLNPTNGDRATTTVTIQVDSSALDTVYLPFLHR